MQGAIFIKFALPFIILLAASVTVSDARGGRRGGGSLGGIFGGWRKYKKPVSTGNSRRTTNGSPMHTPITTATGGNIGAGGASSSSIKSGMQSKTQASYPRQQQMPPGSGAGHYQHGGPGAHLPPGGAYYANTAAMPPGAVYYAQPPLMQSSSGNGDFLIGMMAGHVLSNGLYGHRHHVTHVYQQNQQDPTVSGASKVIIINNGGEVASASPTEQIRTTTISAKFWPTETDVPLAPFNSSHTPVELQLVPGKDIIFPRVSSDNKLLNTQIHSNQPEAIDAAPIPQTPAPTPPTEQQRAPPTPPGGIICVPMLFNETDPNDPTKTRHVEQLVCYPAPVAPPPALSEEDKCLSRTVTVIDPSDPTKTIEVQRQDCLTEHPPQIAGEIGESVGTALPPVKQLQVETAPATVEEIPEEVLPSSLESLEI